MCKRSSDKDLEEITSNISSLSRPSDEEIILPCPVNYEEKLDFKLEPFSKKDSKFISTLPPATKINTIFTSNTEYNADSVEWCPHEPYQHLFVCANYYLCNDKNSSQRLGRILLYSINSDSGLTILQKLITAGVLDQKWCPLKISGQILLGVVTSKGSIEIYRLLEEDLVLQLVWTYTVKSPDNKECLLLSLDWSVIKVHCQEPDIICSDSLGRVHKFRISKNEIVHVKCWEAHQYEAWIAAFDYWNPNIFFTGGDDSLLLKFDVRVSESPVAKNKSHGAGVTCIQSNWDKEHLLASGSYDSYLRLWDTRNMKCPQEQLEMPGTLWRVKWDPFIKRLLLVACMMGGVHIVNTIDNDIKIVESYYEHKSIAYGVDWCHLPSEEVNKYKYAGNRIIASCSFYDNLLCVSRACLCPYCTCLSGCYHAK